MDTMLRPGFILIRLETSSSAGCLLEHDGPMDQTIALNRQLKFGGAGTILQTHEDVEAFSIGDVVVACLSDQNATTGSRGNEVFVVHESFVCRLSANAPRDVAAGIPMAFVIATVLLDKAGFISLPFQPTDENEQEDESPRNVLLISNNTTLPLMIIKLLRIYTISTVFVVYDPESEGDVSIDPAMIAGAHFAQQPSPTSDLWDVARGLRSNLGHYGPFSSTGCFDLVLNLTGKSETPEPYQRLLCPECGRLLQLPETLHIDFEWLFAEVRIMKELGRLLESGQVDVAALNISHS